jgi:hypothetical protein
MTAPWPEFGLGLIAYLLVFGLMLAGNVYVVIRLFPRSGTPATLADATILIGILLMAMGLWFALIYAFLDPGGASEVSVFIALNSMMAVVGCWAIALFLRAETKPLGGPRWQWPAVFTILILGNELLMGSAFVLAQVGPSGYSAIGWAGLAALVGDSVTSVWFYWAMLSNMLIVVYWLPLDRASRTALLGFSATASLGPWLVTAPLGAGIAMGVLMVLVLFATVLERRRGPLGLSYVRTLVVVWGGFVLMAIGEGAFLSEPSAIWKTFLLGLATIGAMGAELLYLIDSGLEARRSIVPRLTRSRLDGAATPPVAGT